MSDGYTWSVSCMAGGFFGPDLVVMPRNTSNTEQVSSDEFDWTEEPK